MNNLIILKNINILPELFLGICIVYIIIFGSILGTSKKYPLIQNTVLNISILVLVLCLILNFNDTLIVKEILSFNSTILSDYMSFIAKSFILIFSIICLIMIQNYVKDQRLNQFEYIVIILLSTLGSLLLCSSNDLLTAYLSIELQSLSFYIMASFKKNSSFSVDAGLKYFILGSFSSALFLFGASLIYGITGTINFSDFNDLYALYNLDLLSDKFKENLTQDIPVVLEPIICNLLLNLTCSIGDQSVNLINTANDVFAVLKQSAIVKEPCLNGRLTRSYHLITEYKQTTAALLLESLKIQFSNMVNDIQILLEQLHIHQYENYPKNLEKKLFDALFIFSYIDSIESTQHATTVIKTLVENLNHEVKYFIMANPLVTINKSSNILDLLKIIENLLVKPEHGINVLLMGLLFILVSLFFKLAIAPVHAWSPDVYEGSPTSSTLFFAVVSKLGIIVLLIRIFYNSFYNFTYNWRYFVIIIALLSIIIGSFTAIEQKKLKSLLAYSSISHMGYILMGFSTNTAEGVQSIFSYILIYMLAGSCIWAVFVILRIKASYKKKNKDLSDISSLIKSNSLLAIIFSIVLFSIAGFPPLVGFLVKINIFLSLIESSIYFISCLAILTSVVSTFYYIRIIKIICFENTNIGLLYHPLPYTETVLIIIQSFLLVFFFINPTLLYLATYKIVNLF